VTDAELILIGGLLLGAGIAAAMIADKVRVPGLVLFLGLGMLVGSEGPGGVEFDDVELTQTLGTIGIVLILFEGGLNAGWPEIRPVLKTAISLAVVGTILTAVIAAAAAAWLFGLGTLEALILGSAIAATDSAAIFAVLRGSSLRRRVARALEGESGLNDPVAVLLVTGFISWLEKPGWGIEDMLLSFAGEIVVGTAVGMLVGLGARWAFVRLDYPTPGLYPVASVAAAALAFGFADLGHGSGLLAVYLTGLTLGTGIVPGQRTVTAFHQGLGWVAQISLFFLLGLLVLPSELADVALEGTAFALVLIFVARPIATHIATQVERYQFREQVMLSWAGLRGAVPIWLATLPVIAGIQGSGFLFNDIFYVVVISTLLQGFTFEPLARRLGLTTSEAALSQPIVETGTIRELGGDVFAIRIDDDDAAAGRMVKELGLPREALISVIVRDGEALLPRGSTLIAGGDELHVLIRRERHGEIERLVETWHEGPIAGPPEMPIEMRGSPAIFTVRPTRPEDGDTGDPATVDGVEVALTLRTRPDVAAAVVVLADGRFAVTGPDLVAVGGRHDLSRWCTRRARGGTVSPQDRAWLQEAIGSIDAPDLR